MCMCVTDWLGKQGFQKVFHVFCRLSNQDYWRGMFFCMNCKWGFGQFTLLFHAFIFLFFKISTLAWFSKGGYMIDLLPPAGWIHRRWGSFTDSSCFIFNGAKFYCQPQTNSPKRRVSRCEFSILVMRPTYSRAVFRSRVLIFTALLEFRNTVLEMKSFQCTFRILNLSRHKWCQYVA